MNFAEENGIKENELFRFAAGNLEKLQDAARATLRANANGGGE
jgi:hypothetical protein